MSRLTRLQLLSLKNNNLRELPPEIGAPSLPRGLGVGERERRERDRREGERRERGEREREEAVLCTPRSPQTPVYIVGGGQVASGSRTTTTASFPPKSVHLPSLGVWVWERERGEREIGERERGEREARERGAREARERQEVTSPLRSDTSLYS